MIRNIVFDMGMVLLDHDPLLPCIRHAGRERAQALCDGIFWHPEWMELLDGGVMDEQAYIPRAQSRFEDPEMKRLVAEILNDWYLDALYPKSGMEAVQKDLLDRGFRLYVLSNAGYSFHKFSYKIKHIDRFSGIMVSAEERLMKPDPAIYRRLCDRFLLEASECLFIDDLPRNIEGAQKAGMNGYCFQDAAAVLSGSSQRLRGMWDAAMDCVSGCGLRAKRGPEPAL